MFETLAVLSQKEVAYPIFWFASGVVAGMFFMLHADSSKMLLDFQIRMEEQELFLSSADNGPDQERDDNFIQKLQCKFAEFRNLKLVSFALGATVLVSTLLFEVFASPPDAVRRFSQNSALSPSAQKFSGCYFLI
jgi:hypothetical protein